MVSIIILTKDNLTYTKQCLESLFENVSYIRTPFEVIVVDNGSTDGTVQYLQGLEQAGQVKAIYNQDNKGFPEGINQGAKIAMGEFLLLLNNDTLLTPEFLEKMLRSIRGDEKVGAVSCYTNHSSGYQQVTPQPTYRGQEELEKYAEKFRGEEKYVDFLVFFCVLIKKQIFEELGGLSEKMGIGTYEDNIFCYRLLEKGYKMKVVGNCFVHHYGSQTFGQKENPKKSEFFKKLMAHNQKLFLKEVGQYRTISLCVIVSENEKKETLFKMLDSLADFVDEICLYVNYKNFPKSWKFNRLKREVEKRYANISFDNTKIPSRKEK